MSLGWLLKAAQRSTRASSSCSISSKWRFATPSLESGRAFLRAVAQGSQRATSPGVSLLGPLACSLRCATQLDQSPAGCRSPGVGVGVDRSPPEDSAPSGLWRACSRATQRTPASAWGSSRLHLWKPNTWALAAWIQNPKGGLSTETNPASKEAKKKLCQLASMFLTVAA